VAHDDLVVAVDLDIARGVALSDDRATRQRARDRRIAERARRDRVVGLVEREDARLDRGGLGVDARAALGVGIGSVSAMMGIGGGTLGVPLLSLLGYPIRAAVATASAFGVIIAIPATLGMILGGWGDARVPPFSLGYVSLIGFALIAPSSIIATPWGVKLAHTIPPLLLKRAFAVFLAITSARMFWSIFT
jgi:uncharacterized membrane protein YfcA